LFYVDRQTDMTNLVVTFRNCVVKAPVGGEVKAIERGLTKFNPLYFTGIIS